MTSSGQKTHSTVPTERNPNRQIQFEGTPALQQALRALCREFIDIFSTAVRPLPAKVKSMVIDIDRSKWEIPSNRLPQRHHSAEKQTAIRTQVDALLKLGVIEESRAAHWSQVHPVLKSPGKWRLTLDFVKLNAATGGLEGWPILEAKYTTNSISAGYNETNSVWPIGLHCRLSPDAAGPSLETPHGFHGHEGIVSMDPSSHGIERIWPLLSTQHVEHSPSWARVSNLRAVHRR